MRSARPPLSSASAVRIAAIVLAAGAGRRMGGPKALLPFHGSTFLESALRALSEAGISERLVVLDPGSPIFARAARIVAEQGAKVVENPEAKQGMLSSARCGLKGLDPAATHAALLPVDHPGISPDTLRALLARAAERPTSIILPAFHGRRGHPGLFPAALFPELLAAPDSEGARWVLRQHPELIELVEVPDEATVRDFDSPEDLDPGGTSA